MNEHIIRRCEDMNNKRHMKKGFSLIELIVVIMIIGVLSMIVGLAWNNWIYRTRIKSANSKAKIIFNAAQTEAIKFSQAERLDPNNGYMTNGNYYFYWNGSSGGYMVSATKSAANSASSFSAGSANKDKQQTARFTDAINRIAGTDGQYKIWIKDYKVQAVTYVPNSTSRYLGSYPVQQSDPSDLANPKPLNADMDVISTVT